MTESDQAETRETEPFEDLGASGGSAIRLAGGRAVLVGGECRACGRRSFPRRRICVSCAGDDVAEADIGDRGTLYSFSTVHVSSSRAAPYTLGYIDLPHDVRILATIAGDPTRLRPDIPVALSVEADGGWSFAPENPGEPAL